LPAFGTVATLFFREAVESKAFFGNMLAPDPAPGQARSVVAEKTAQWGALGEGKRMAKRPEAVKAKKTAVSAKKPKVVQGKPKTPPKAVTPKGKAKPAPAAAKKSPVKPARAAAPAPKKAVPAKKGAVTAKTAKKTPPVAQKKKSIVAAPKKAALPAKKQKAVAVKAKTAPPAKKQKAVAVKAKAAPPAKKQKAVAVKAKAALPAKKQKAVAVKAKAALPAKKKPAAVPKKPVVQTKVVAKIPAKQAAKAPIRPEKAPKVAEKPVPKPAKPVSPPPKPVTAPVKEKAPAPARKEKMVPPIPVAFLVELAQTIKEAVEESARAVRGREVVSHAESGDVTFQLDKIAEKALLNFLKRAGQPVAYYSEDAGYSTFTSEKPKHLLVVDPIDGSRAAKSGFEGCVVAVASTRVIERPTMADVDSAVVLELLGDRCFQAERGKGVKITAGSQPRRPKLSVNTELRTMIWSMTVPGRPAELVFPTVARLIDHSSLEGGFFACNSTAYSLTRLLTNQLDACVDIANRYYRDIPEKVQRLFENAGQGRVIGIAPYDLAAALLVAQEAGCVVTDAYGKNFNDVLLLDSTASNHLSLVAAASKGLHAKLMEFLVRRIEMVESRFQALPSA